MFPSARRFSLFLWLSLWPSIGLSACGGWVMTTSGLGAAPDDTTSFFFDAAAADTKHAYAQLCPSVRAALDYRAFAVALLHNPFARHNAGFDGVRTTALLGSGVQRVSGYVGTLAGVLPAELTLGTDGSHSCVLGATIAGTPVLPPFGSVGPPAPTGYLEDAGVKEALGGHTFDAVTSGGLVFTVTFAADGTRELAIGAEKEPGVWRVADGRVCKKDKKDTAEHCVRYLRRDDGALEAFDEEGFSHSTLRAKR